jgi:hypothetical protein
MTRNEKRKALREAHYYLRYHHHVREDFDKEYVRWDKEKLLEILAICQKAIKLHGGKIREADYHRQENGSYKAVYTDVADAKIVAGIVKERLMKVERIITTIVPTPPPPREVNTHCYGYGHRHAMIYVQRAVKRKQRIKAERTSHSTPWKQAVTEDDEQLELELSFKDRVPHRHGWGRTYRPTRDVWSKHGDKKTWKNKKCLKQYLVHLD